LIVITVQGIRPVEFLIPPGLHEGQDVNG